MPTIRLEGRERRAFLLMAGVLTLGGTVMAMVSVHLITLLQARGVALTSAVAYGALIGPAQVGARIVEMAGKGRHHPLWTLTAAMILVVLGVAMLTAGLPLVGLALVLYGAGNGIYSIARGNGPPGPVRSRALRRARRPARPSRTGGAGACPLHRSRGPHPRGRERHLRPAQRTRCGERRTCPVPLACPAPKLGWCPETERPSGFHRMAAKREGAPKGP